MNIIKKSLELTNNNMPFVIITVVKKSGEGPFDVGKKMIVTKKGDFFGTVGGGAIEHDAVERSRQLILDKKSDLISYILNENEVIKDEGQVLPMACGGRATLYFEYVGTKEKVYLFGAGHVGQALANVLNTLDFKIVVVDDRKPVIDAFVGADEKHNVSFIDFIDNNGIDDDSYVIVCTPSHKYDYDVLNKVFSKGIKPKYIGMLCSVHKLKDYISKLKEKVTEPVDFTNFYSPIGLDIGGNSPEEIAISITSEMIAIKNGKDGHKHMRLDYD